MKPLLALLFLLLACPAYGQTINYYKESNKIGIKTQEGKIIIPAILYAEPKFNEGIALCRDTNDIIYVIDTTGIIHFSFYRNDNNYEYEHKFSEGLLALHDPEQFAKMGFKNLKNEWVVKPLFYEVRDFKNGVALVWENMNMHVDTGSDCGSPVTHEEWTFIDNSGKGLTPKFKFEGQVINDTLVFNNGTVHARFTMKGRKIQ